MDDLAAKYTPKATTTLTYHRQLWQARFTPCGGQLIAAGYDAQVVRWDVREAEARPLPPLTGHHGWLQCLALAPQGKLLYSADSWGRLTAWPYEGESPQPAWSVDQAIDGWIRSLAISPDGSTLAIAGNDPCARLFTAADGRPAGTLPGHPGDVYSVAFHPDGKHLVTGDLFGTIRHWDLASGQVVRTIDTQVLYKLNSMQETGGVRHLAFDPAGKQLVAAGIKNPSGGFVTGTPAALVIDWQTAAVQQELILGANDDGYVYDAVFHPAGFLMLTCGAFPGKGQSAFWQPGQEKPFYSEKKLANGRSISLHPGGKLLAVVISNAANGNGRPKTKDATYDGGSARIQLLEFPA